MSSPATGEAALPGVNADGNLPTQDYNPHALVGALLDEDEEPIPLLYFTSFCEAWVRTTLYLACLTTQSFVKHS